METKPANLKQAEVKPAKIETKAERFRRVATSRVNKALEQIRLLGNLGVDIYEHTDEDLEKIESALNDAVKQCLADLRRGKPKPFSLLD